MIDKRELGVLVYTDPLGLLALKSKEDIELANSYLPYSTGFEIECNQNNEVYSYDSFSVIPNIMEIKSDSNEQRYRIPNGINGLICLYHISNEAKRSLLLNFGSGIHYHVDCTDCWRVELAQELKNQHVEILDELSLWKDKGTYNGRGVSNGSMPGTGFRSDACISNGAWVRANSLQTLEFRIGRMTFEYEEWVKCIVQCNAIVKRLKDNVPDVPQPVYNFVDKRMIMKYNYQILQGKVNKSREDALKEKLAKLTAPIAPAPTGPSLDEIRASIRNRTQNL